jgi:glycosyltransferase involved in cell wall biosynthesis
MGAKQGLEGLVDVARLAEKHDSSVRVVLMGNGSRRNSLCDYAEGCNRVTIVDSLPAGQFEAALTAADCLVLHEKPGVVEMSVPSKLTTYFTAGRPVVAATDPRSGAADLMTAARAGHVVRSGDPHAVLRAIEALAHRPAEAVALGENGERYAAEHLTGGASLRRKTAWVGRLVQPAPSGALQRT